MKKLTCRANCKTPDPKKIDDFGDNFKSQRGGARCKGENIPAWAGEEVQRKLPPKRRFYEGLEFCNWLCILCILLAVFAANGSKLYAAPCAPPPCVPCMPCDPCAPCAPVCGTNCGLSLCAVGVAVLALVAAAAIILTSGEGENVH